MERPGQAFRESACLRLDSPESDLETRSNGSNFLAGDPRKPLLGKLGREE